MKNFSLKGFFFLSNELCRDDSESKVKLKSFLKLQCTKVLGPDGNPKDVSRAVHETDAPCCTTVTSLHLK